MDCWKTHDEMERPGEEAYQRFFSRSYYVKLLKTDVNLFQDVLFKIVQQCFGCTQCIEDQIKIQILKIMKIDSSFNFMKRIVHRRRRRCAEEKLSRGKDVSLMLWTIGSQYAFISSESIG